MTLFLLSIASLALTTPPAYLFFKNLRAYLPPPPPDAGRPPRVSVLIPARDEERSIGGAVESALASKGVAVEVLVLNDGSRDATAAVVRRIAERDDRVRLLHAPELPPGWCGKQHACRVLANEASADLLLFLDADVRLTPYGLARMAAFLRQSGADLVSAVPFQETGTALERLVVPLIHFVLLAFLPLERMRRSRHPAYGAGCGQLFLARRSGYEKAGGHAAVRASLHDGVTLPRAFRRAGLATDLCDGTDVARCRMYRGAGELWRGFAKNATEGMAAPATIGPATLLLLGQVAPVALMATAALLSPPSVAPAAAATVCVYFPRFAAAGRFGQPLLGAFLHPVGVAILLAIQWHAFVKRLFGRPACWKGRAYRSAAGE